MRKSFISSSLILILFSSMSFAQLAKDSWAVGFGFDYPRFESINITPKEWKFRRIFVITKKFFRTFRNKIYRWLGTYDSRMD